MAITITKPCEYKVQTLEYDEDCGEDDVIKCTLFNPYGIGDYGYCDGDTDKEYCNLYQYIKKVVEKKEKQNERAI